MRKIGVLIVILLLGFSCSSNDGGTPSSPLPSGARVVFLGASITESFYYPEWGQFFPGYDFRKVITYQPDKSSTFPQIRSLNPKIVVFKECGAYFDRGGQTDLVSLRSYMAAIADFCLSIGAIPVPATVLPIDVGPGGCTQAQLDDIIEFNNWVRNFCSANGYTCMDYYAQLADGQGQLPTGYHDGDGLHPNQAGYNALAPLIPRILGPML